MLTKAKLRLIQSLDSRKWRQASGLFVAEGPKLVSELIGTMECTYLLLSSEWAEANSDIAIHLTARAASEDAEVEHVSSADFCRASLLQTPQGVLALFRIPKYEKPAPSTLSTTLSLALDGVQDPGNLGTIVRLADWFGIRDILCSQQTADVWNPKAVQATMGSIARVRVHYYNSLCDVLSSISAYTPVYATMLNGDPIWSATLEQRGIIVMGNEGRGVSPEVAQLCNNRLLIPPYPPEHATTDSLNVGVATAIVLAEFRRRAEG